MLMPKRVKRRRVQKGRIKGNAQRGTRVDFGDFGIKAIETGRISSRQIEAARIVINVLFGLSTFRRAHDKRELEKTPRDGVQPCFP